MRYLSKSFFLIIIGLLVYPTSFARPVNQLKKSREQNHNKDNLGVNDTCGSIDNFARFMNVIDMNMIELGLSSFNLSGQVFLSENSSLSDDQIKELKTLSEKVEVQQNTMKKMIELWKKERKEGQNISAEELEKRCKKYLLVNRRLLVQSDELYESVRKKPDPLLHDGSVVDQ